MLDRMTEVSTHADLLRVC